MLFLANCCHGTKFEWCSISVIRISFLFLNNDFTVYANRFIDSVALLVNIISSGFAFMNLATISKDNKPSSRIVLLKSFSVNGFVFYTNTLSKKGNSLENNKYAALNFIGKVCSNKYV